MARSTGGQLMVAGGTSATTSAAGQPDPYRDRIGWLTQVMDDRGMTGALLDGPEAVAYMTGYTPPTTMYQACFIPIGSPPILVVRANDRTRAGRHARYERIVTYEDWGDPVSLLMDVIRDTGGVGPIGKDMDSMVFTSAISRRLTSNVDIDGWIDISDDLARARAVKSTDELELHRRAAEVAAMATQAGIGSVLSGNELAEAALSAHIVARRAGADDRRTVVAKTETSPDGFSPTSMIELVPAISGYDARLIRTVAHSTPSNEQLEAARIVLQIQDAQIAAMRPGAMAADVDAICRDAIVSRGLRESYPGLTGHGLGFSWVGRTTDANYRFTPAAKWRLEPGMIFHMYTRARGFVIGDTVLVTDSQPELLTTVDRQLFTAGQLGAA